ncbi:MAG: phosphopantetheine-binding protein [Oscillospiraceae bacterium]|nr:phosphopantetheine-binding protein [Oscillospiraceae bacterium]
MREQILELLTALRSDVDFETETALIDDEVLDSFDIVTLVGDLNEAFDIEITVADLTPENFNSVDAMVELVQSMIVE